MAEDQTTDVQRRLDRLRAGDPSARDELIAVSCERLARLTRKMLKGYPGVGRWEQTDDVLQNAALRLRSALEAVTPDTVRDYFGLAALQIRRELLDLARHYYGPHGHGAHHLTEVGDGTGGRPGAGPDPAEATGDPARLAAWAEFHDQIGALAEEERKTVELLWYHGLSQAEAASVMGVSERTLQRYWQSARLRLREALGDALPG
jgi:RNA polymerase sigma-70 factor (ECF subfamily)